MNLSVPQSVIGGLGIIGVTILAALGKLDGATVIAFFSLVVGNSLGYVNGKKVATKDAATTAIAVAHEATLTALEQANEKSAG